MKSHQQNQRFGTLKTGSRLSVIAVVLSIALPFATQSHAESRIRANNQAYFQDETLVQANAHQVNSLAYGEALYLMHTEQDLAALVRLEQEELASGAQSPSFDLHTRLLQASIAATQGLQSYAQTALDQATSTQNQTNQLQRSARQYDIDRLFFFKSQLAYEQKDQNRLREGLSQIRQPEQLSDPDSLFYLQVHGALQEDNLEGANSALSQMALSPWRAISQINIALWHYRQNDFPTGLDLLTRTLEEIDSSIQYSAEEYWYNKGRRQMTVLDADAHEKQQTELSHLSDRILTLIGFGHMKQITEEQTAANALHLEAAQTAIFQIPQSSIFATQGLELLAQSLFTELESTEKETLFENPERLAENKQRQRTSLGRILQKLADPKQPVLTRLRSQFKLLKINAHLPPRQRMNQLESTIADIESDIQSREQLIQAPLQSFEQILGPFYQTSHLGQGFDISNLDISALPTHRTQFIQWLSRPQTKEFLKTLRFFQAAANFVDDWSQTQPLLLSQATQSKQLIGSNADAARQAQSSLLDSLQQVRTQLNETNQLPASQTELQYQVKAQKVLSTLAQVPTTTKAQEDWIKQRQDVVRFQQGQIQWQQLALAPTRLQQARLNLQQAKALLNESETRSQRLLQPPVSKKLSIQKVTALDKKIAGISDQVQQALAANKKLFLESFKTEIIKEHQHLRAALVQLRLEQAALLQLAGDESE